MACNPTSRYLGMCEGPTASSSRRSFVRGGMSWPTGIGNGNVLLSLGRRMCCCRWGVVVV
jgi:hypothetical protein